MNENYTVLEKEKRCVWRKVADNDLEKKVRGEGYITLSEVNECYQCDGYNKICLTYVPE